LRQYQLERSAGDLGLEQDVVMARCAKLKRVEVDQLREDPDLWLWTQHKIALAHVPVNSVKINQELGTLQRILKRAGLWGIEFDECYQPLQVIPSDVPRAMSQEEQTYFLEVAASRLEWELAYKYCLVALETGMTNCEMRGLHISDVNLHTQVLQVRAAHAKNTFRIRTIPLSGEDAQWAADMLLQRARALGSFGPADYLFPFCTSANGRGDTFDPRRPMSESGIKRAFLAIRDEANVPWLRIHDLRHCAITRMAEAGMPIAAIMAIAGHISPMMTRHYTQVSLQAMRKFQSQKQTFGRRGTDSRTRRPGATASAAGLIERREVKPVATLIRHRE
jgi:integrase